MNDIDNPTFNVTRLPQPGCPCCGGSGETFDVYEPDTGAYVSSDCPCTSDPAWTGKEQ